jgi:hypothetical protein
MNSGETAHLRLEQPDFLGIRAAPLVHAKGVVHADSACVKFFRTHRSTPNNANLSGLSKSEDFHAIVEGPLV